MKYAPLILALGFVVLESGCSTTRSWSGSEEIYDTKADGEQQVAAALARAGREGRRVLLSLGASWCGDSQAMYHLLQTDRNIRRELERHYVLAMVDVNQQDAEPRNTNTVARFNNPIDHGIPVLLVLAPDGRLLNDDPNERLADSDHQHPDRVLAYLRKWAASGKP